MGLKKELLRIKPEHMDAAVESFFAKADTQDDVADVTVQYPSLACLLDGVDKAMTESGRLPEAILPFVRVGLSFGVMALAECAELQAIQEQFPDSPEQRDD